jgi:hypothetical protein
MAYMTSSLMEIFLLFFAASWHFSGLVCLSMLCFFFSSTLSTHKKQLRAVARVHLSQLIEIKSPRFPTNYTIISPLISLARSTCLIPGAREAAVEEGRGERRKKANGIRHGSSCFISRGRFSQKAGYIASLHVSCHVFSLSERNFFSTIFRSLSRSLELALFFFFVDSEAALK